MEKHHSRVFKGTIEIPAQQIKGTITGYEAEPNKSYTVVELPGVGKIESGTDGEVFWELSQTGGARILEGEEKAFKQRESVFNSQLHWRKLYKKAECVAIEDVDGHPCYKIVLTPEVGPPQTFYYDCQSYLALRTDVTLKTPIGPVPVQVRIDDYRKVDGVLIPHKVVQSMLGMEQLITLERVECNVDVPPDRFALPDPVKELLSQKAREKEQAATRPAQTP